MVQNVEKDPFDMSGPVCQAMVPKGTREIMFAVLTKDRSDALTPSELKEQVANLRRLAQAIEWAVDQWDRKEPYYRVLAGIERAIQETNAETNIIRRRSKMAAKDRRAQIVSSKVASINFGVERMPVDSGAKPTYREDYFSGEGTRWRQRGKG